MPGCNQSDPQPEAVWVRYVDLGSAETACAALDTFHARATVLDCTDEAKLVEALRIARGAKIVVLDSHGWTTQVGMGRTVAPGGPDYPLEHILNGGPLDECELLILGGCKQGHKDIRAKWHKVAPNAVVMGVDATVRDGPGCNRIAEIIAFAQGRPGWPSAAELNDRKTRLPRFVASDPESNR